MRRRGALRVRNGDGDDSGAGRMRRFRDSMRLR